VQELCEGQVVVVTGAGNGIGRCHALAFAQVGAKVVVNDVGAARDGTGASVGPAQAVVDEIVAAGGEAVANTDDISSWDGAERLIRQAVDTYGRLDTLVNNAGILRDRMLVNMEEAEWDAVIRVHLKGTFAPTRHAAAHWRDRSKAGEEVDARVVNTASPSGIFGNVGQANYGAAKAGIASFTLITAEELGRYGVRVNAIAPVALTRMTEGLSNVESLSRKDGWDPVDPANISPLVVWLGSPESRGVTGRVFSVSGGRISVNEGWVNGPTVDAGRQWDPAELTEIVPALVAQAAPNANMNGQRK